jgi:hypothetical protein
MTSIPASNWVLKKTYFEATLVDNFDSLYKEWLKKEGENINNWFNLSPELDRFISNLGENPTVELYQFPNERSGLDHDYFEKDDDNHVIPRFLFEPIKIN